MRTASIAESFNCSNFRLFILMYSQVNRFAYLQRYQTILAAMWIIKVGSAKKRGTLTNASEQVVHAVNNTATQFAAHPSTLVTSSLPVAAMVGFVPGLMMGFKKG
jgi:hypothetical protein